MMKYQLKRFAFCFSGKVRWMEFSVPCIGLNTLLLSQTNKKDFI